MASILLVEDNEDHALLARSALSRSDQKYDVDHSATAFDCIDMLKKKDYEAIVLDYSLPKRNGLEILQDIRKMSYNAPVVMITSHGDEQIAVESMKLGAYDYVAKSDDYLTRLPLVLERAIKDHEMTRERIQLQAKIEESENRLRNIFENVDVGIIEINPECEVSYTNKKAKNYLGIVDDIDNLVCALFSQNGHGRGNCSDCIIKRCLNSGYSTSCEIKYKDKQFNATVTAVKLDRVNVNLLVAVIMDITEQRNLQKQLIQSERIGALGRMASGVAHDFNNILAAILGRAELMIMSMPKSEDLEKDLKIMQKAALDGAETVRRIQEFSGVAKQREFTPLKVNDIISDVLQMTEPRWKDQPQRDGLKLEVSTDLKSQLSVAGSASDLREVLTNMVFNSLDAMPTGGELSIKTGDDGRQVYISIADTGIGIAPEVVGSLFEPFFTSKGAGHTGLGLSVAYGIISRHDGKIDVNSKQGKGTMFTIRLPACMEVAKAEESTEPIINPSGARILTIDDEETIRDLLVNILVRFDHQVSSAADGMTGINIFKNGEYDIVFTDLGMPEVSGWEVAQQVKEMDPDVKVVLITGWGVELDESKLADRKVDYVIAKPFQISQIQEVVSKAMECKV